MAKEKMIIGAMVLATVGLATTAPAQTLSAQDLARRTTERRAIEAVIWGMPAVNLDLMLQAMTGSAKGKPKDRKSTRLNSSHYGLSRMPSSA